MSRRERRAHRRYPFVLAVEYPSEPSAARDWTENLSAGGLFVRTERHLNIGERFTIRIGFPGFFDPTDLEVQVVRRRGPDDPEGPPGLAVVVPLDRPASRQRLAALAAMAEDAEASHHPYRVLLVEDNQLVAAMYTSALKRLSDRDGLTGLAIEHAGDGSQALERLARPPAVDVLITDVYMPVMSGFVLLQKIRAQPRLRDLPVVVISSGSKHERDEAARHGAQYFLLKPVKYQEITAIVRTLLTASAHRARAKS